MRTAGENSAANSAELGHKDFSVTARIYAGFLAEQERRNFGSVPAEQYREIRR
jgi:hypothetical protein